MTVDGAAAGRRQRMCKRLNITLWVLWGLFFGYSVAVAVDPTGIGGVQEPDGLEGVGLVVSLFALPFVIAISWLLVRAGRRAREVS